MQFTSGQHFRRANAGPILHIEDTSLLLPPEEGKLPFGDLSAKSTSPQSIINLLKPMRRIIAFGIGLMGLAPAPVFAQQTPPPRDLFNISRVVSGSASFPDYDPYRLSKLYSDRHEIELQMFDSINEAAVRRDPNMKRFLDLYGDHLGYTALLAAAHYKWVFGDKSQLDWLLAEDEKRGIGRDSLILIVFGYMDEWDKTIRWLKKNAEVANGDAGEIVAEAIRIRKRLYGVKRFEKAWRRAKTNKSQ